MSPLAAYSAPGKALLAGGYLVLFPEYSALSVGLSSRMHAVAFDTPSRELVVSSPQFNSEWHFPSKSGPHKNPFLEACYETVKSYFGHEIVGSIVIYSDAGFHSQEHAQENGFDGSTSRFSFYNKHITDVPKTGLGSSAALVVAVVAAMAKLAAPEKPELGLQKLHNLAQVAHCLAQQKVGSGFDVATAVHGSILYSRFAADEIPEQVDHKPLVDAVNTTWTMRAEPVDLPANISVLMGDVSQGSETPGMVKQVLQWKANHPVESEAVFRELNAANMALAATLNTEHGDREQINRAIAEVRRCLKKLTTLSKVPIEPDTQTQILDEATKVDGVLGGVVPGAGGDDAVCLLVDTSVASTEEILGDLAKIDGVSWMSLQLERSGLRTEDVNEYI